MFVVLEFVVEELVEIAPKSWLLKEGSVCVWPPSSVKPYEVAALVKKEAAPQYDWQHFAVKVISEATTYEGARKKLKKASSDYEVLTTDSENCGRGKRRRFKPALYSSSDSESDTFPSAKARRIISSLPMPPPLTVVNKVTGNKTNNAVNENTCNKSQPEMTSIPRVDLCSPSTSYKESSILTSVFRELEVLRTEQKKQRQLLQTILDITSSNYASANIIPETDFNVSFPMTSEEELENVELSLRDAAAQKFLVSKLRSFGGNNFSDHTRRALRHLLSDSLAESYSWNGSKEKKRFSSLKLSVVIVDAVVEEHKNVSRANVEETIKTWLRHAKERRTYVKKPNRNVFCYDDN